VHEKGWEEKVQGARVVAGARQRVGFARGLDRLDDATDGSSHAIARTLERMEENADPARLLGVAAIPLTLQA
jgi:hypothetical protein